MSKRNERHKLSQLTALCLITEAHVINIFSKQGLIYCIIEECFPNGTFKFHETIISSDMRHIFLQVKEVHDINLGNFFDPEDLEAKEVH